MSRYAERIAPVPVKTKAPPAARQQSRPVPTPLSHILQLRAAESAKAAAAPSAPDRTGLPAGLKAGVEQLSGIAMDDVRVHRNSAEPARLGADAYARGSDIHLGPGQERHLPHEAWHVVQQKQGRGRPTMQLKGAVAINDESGLESEADAMGAKALAAGGNVRPAPSDDLRRADATPVVQRTITALAPGCWLGAFADAATLLQHYITPFLTD